MLLIQADWFTRNNLTCKVGKKMPGSDRQDWWVIFQWDDKAVCSPVLCSLQEMINLRCLLHLFRLFRCFFVTCILELPHVVEWKRRCWTGEKRCLPHPGQHNQGGQGLGAHTFGRRASWEECLLWAPCLPILDEMGWDRSWVLHSSFVAQHFLHLVAYVHLQKTPMSSSAWCQLDF